MKRYVPIIIGVVALCAVLYLGSNKINSNEEILKNEEATSSQLTSKTFQGSVTKVFKGNNTLGYGFDLPETASAAVTMDGALVKVTDSDMPVLAMYISFEGGRGYSPADYITNNIIPKVSGITQMGTKMIGGYEWTVVASANSEWHVASVENGKWLLVAESKKADSDKALAILESVAVSTPSVDSVDTKEAEDTVGASTTDR